MVRSKYLSLVAVGAMVAFSPVIQGKAYAYESTNAEILQGVYFRESPSTSSSPIRMLRRGESVQVLDQINAYWYKVKDDKDVIGYVSTSQKYMQLDKTANTEISGDTNAEIIKSVSFRESPSVKGARIRYLKAGEKATIIEKVNAYWFKIKDPYGTVGYASTSNSYIKTTFNEGATGTAPPTAPALPSYEIIQKVIQTGKKYMGTPYEFGSSRSDTSTFDCSDFVRQAYLEGAGIKLPADSRSQGDYIRRLGNAITDWRQLQPGDLMFFMSYKGPGKASYEGINKSSERITHDGIYLGNGLILHTYSKESGGVRIDSIEGKHWENRFLFGGSVVK